MASTKPYRIAKRAVWEAYQLVKANRGAAGVDDETIPMFEQNLSGNLYKLWNRMSSGSYFPPPVKQVEIPKAKGGTRRLAATVFRNRAQEGRKVRGWGGERRCLPVSFVVQHGIENHEELAHAGGER